MADALQDLDDGYGGARTYLIGPAGVPAATVDRLCSLLLC
jgi:hypothetical protein